MSGLPTPINMFVKNVVVTRYAGGVLVNGFWTDSVASTFTMTASIQPARAEELVDLPQGERTNEHVKIYTESELNPADETSQTQGDRVAWNGHDYEVQKKSPWQMGGCLNHYKYIAARVNP